MQNYNETNGNNNTTLQNIHNSNVNINNHYNNNPTFSLENFPKIHNTSRTPLSHQIIGRDKDLEKVRQMLLTHQQCAVVNGIGGIGKSTLARYYIQQYHTEYQQIIWLNKKEDVYDIFFEDSLLLDNLGIKAQIFEYLNQSNKNAAIHLLMQTLNKLPKPALLILDNVQDLAQLDQLLIPLDKSIFHVLITSRQEKGDFHFHSLDTLAPEDAKDLFCLFYLGTTDSNEPRVIALKANPDLDRILTRAAYHTLTIELLAKILRASNTLTLSSLANRLEEQLINPSLKQKIATKYTNKEATLYEIILFAFDISNIRENKEALELLVQWSVLPSFSIPQDTLFTLFEVTEENLDDFDVLLSFLIENGWIQKSIEDGNSYFCHALIQEAVREQWKEIEKKILEAEKGEKEEGFIYEKLLVVVNQTIFNIDKINFLNAEYLLSYADTLIKYVKNETEAIIDLANTTAFIYGALGNYIKQIDYNLFVISIAKRIILSEEIKLATFYNNLAATYDTLGDYIKALEYYNIALNIGRKILPPKSIRLVAFYNNIALTYFNLKKYDEALEYNTIVLDILEYIYPIDIEKLSMAYTNRALTFIELRKNDDAESYNLKAIEIRKQLLLKNDLVLASIYNNQGLIYSNLSLHSESLKYHSMALNIKKNVLPIKHPDLAFSFNNLACEYYYIHDYIQSLNYFKEAIVIRKESLGLKHNYTQISINSMEDLLKAFIKAGRRNEVEDYISWFLEECKEYIK